MRYDFQVRVDENGDFKVSGMSKGTQMIRMMVPKGNDPLTRFVPMLKERLEKLHPTKKFTTGKMAATTNRFYIWITDEDK